MKGLAKAMGLAACLPHPREHYTGPDSRGACACGTSIVGRYSYVEYYVRGHVDDKAYRTRHARLRCVRRHRREVIRGARW